MEKKHTPKLRSGEKASAIRRCFSFWVCGFMLLSLILVSFSTAKAQTEYNATDVDSKPKIIRKMPITYPSMAKRNRVEGRVVVNVLIGTNGKVSKMEVVESEPEGIFDENAMKSVKNWQFRPGILGGELVPTWVKIPLSFKLD